MSERTDRELGAKAFPGHSSRERPVESAVTRSIKLQQAENQRRAALNLMEDAIQSRQAMERLNADLRTSEERLRRELAATQQLQAISAALIEGGQVQALYEKIVDAAVVIMRSDCASMQIVDERENALRILAWRGFDPEFGRVFELVRADARASCGVARGLARRVIVPDVETCDFIAGTPALQDLRRSGIRAVQSTPLFSRSGKLLGMISTHWHAPHTPEDSDLRQFDILARQAADLIESKRTEMSAQRLAAVVESSDDAIISKDLNGIIMSWNRGAESLFGYTADEVIGKSITLLIPEDHANEEPEILGRIRRGESINHYETVRRCKDGSLIQISLTVSPIKDGAGRVTGASKIARDITNRKRAEQRQQVLTNELAHRGKNLLSIIQAIVYRSLSGTRELEEAREVLAQRIQALARSQSVLLNGAFEGAPMREIIALELEAFSDRAESVGPEVVLNAKAVQTFALLVHELATNATKHGALSRPGGRVTIHWSIEGASAARFKFQWSERGGPPVAAPTRQGFGRILIEKIVGHEFGAQPRIEFAPDGLSYEIETSLSAVVGGDTAVTS